MDDRELVALCVAGERAAWHELVQRNVPVMRAVVLRVLPAGRDGEVEDVLQAVFLKLWAEDHRRLRGFGGRCRLSTWLAAVARREALDRLRKGERHARHTAAAADEAFERLRREVGGLDDPAGEARLDADAARQALDGAVAQLPARERLLVRLIHQDGSTYAEAGRLLQAPENSIGPWLKRAHEKLRGLLCTDPSATDL